jgi:hypothetical protein
MKCALRCRCVSRHVGSCRRLGSRYRSGRTHDWLKFKNPNASASTVKTVMAAIQMDYSHRIQVFIVMTRFSAIVDGRQEAPRS